MFSFLSRITFLCLFAIFSIAGCAQKNEELHSEDELKVRIKEALAKIQPIPNRQCPGRQIFKL